MGLEELGLEEHGLNLAIETKGSVWREIDKREN